MIRINHWKVALARGIVAITLLSLATAARAQKAEHELAGLSLDELINIEVTSASKKEEKLFKTATAIYVITRDDIRRSGLTTVPEVLRMAPGLEVARINANIWAIGARGFNGRFGNKLLVLIDGRSVYSATFAGIYWNVQDVPLDDIERIEVIRGPGTTLWGSNSVNGVINIITKHSRETQGGLITAGGGSEDLGFGSARYGGKIKEDAFYRLYAQYSDRSDLVDSLGHSAGDKWDSLRGGGRLDWNLGRRDFFTLQGDIYHIDARDTFSSVSPAAPLKPLGTTSDSFDGGNVLGRWHHDFSKRSDMTLQFYYDRARRRGVVIGEESSHTFDLDFQNHVAIGSRQDLIWGLGYRLVSSDSKSDSSTSVRFTPKGRRTPLFSGFVQDEVALVKDKLRLTIGSKFEHTDYSGLEVQPSIRALWTPSPHQTLWGAASRAVRTTLHDDKGLRANVAAFPGQNGLPVVVAILGDPRTRPETLRAYEFGYRAQAHDRLSLDIATFYNVYDSLRSSEPGLPFFETDPLPPHLVIPLRFNNLLRGETYGVELSTNVDLTNSWKLSGSYSFLRMQLHRTPGGRDVTGEAAEGNSPRHQFQIHSYLRLPRNLELDTAMYRVSELPNQRVAGYTRLDARLGWRVSEGADLSVGLQNLLDSRHQEFGRDAVVPSRIARSAYAKITWRF